LRKTNIFPAYSNAGHNITTVKYVEYRRGAQMPLKSPEDPEGIIISGNNTISQKNLEGFFAIQS